MFLLKPSMIGDAFQFARLLLFSAGPPFSRKKFRARMA